MTPVLDRIPRFDERSRNFSVRGLLPAPDGGAPSKKKVWTPGPLLDQGTEGACVGFGVSGELAATPVKIVVDNAFALDLYNRARAIDKSEGHNWASGASVLAGLKAAKQLGLIKEYRWCFGVEDVKLALTHAPVVLGINWYDGMYDTDDNGLVSVTGKVVGGHCIYAHGFLPHGHVANIWDDDIIVWQNSWGAYYGAKDRAGVPTGRGFIRARDLASLLDQDGEAAVLADVRRTT